MIMVKRWTDPETFLEHETEFDLFHFEVTKYIQEILDMNGFQPTSVMCDGKNLIMGVMNPPLRLKPPGIECAKYRIIIEKIPMQNNV